MSSCNDCGCLTGTGVYYCKKCIKKWCESFPKKCTCVYYNYCEYKSPDCNFCKYRKKGKMCWCGDIFVFNGLCKNHHILGKYYE